MSELDEAWAAALSEAERKARLAGRGDVAEYLALKNSNDLLRKAGVDADPEVMRWGAPVPPMFSFRDPDGNAIMVVSNE